MMWTQVSGGRPGRVLGAFLAAAAVTLVGGCTSSPPQVTLVVSADHVGPGTAVTLSGALTPAKAGLAVRLESSTGGPFSSTGQAAATDGAGSYSLSFTPSEPGALTLRVEVTDGSDTTRSSAVKLTVLAASTVSAALTGPVEVAVAAKATVTGKVTPAAAGRQVTAQTSTDGTTWTDTAATATTDAAGAYSLRLPTQTAGPLILRISVAATGSAAQGASGLLRLYVADYKAAGAHYLACVKPDNAAIDVNVNATNAFNRGAISFTALKRTNGAQAAADRAEIVCMHSYLWPPSVAGLIADFQAQDAVDADYENQASRAKNLTDYNAIGNATTWTTAVNEIGGDAAKIRRLLGLPARS